MKKSLRVVILGIMIWGIGLIWPQINKVLTPPLMAGSALGLAAMMLAYLLGRRYTDYDESDGSASRTPRSQSATHDLNSAAAS